MKTFLQRFAVLVAGVLQGFDRLVFRGKLCQLYSPDGMHILLNANHVLRNDFKSYAAQVTANVLRASRVSEAKALGRYRYLNSSKTDKEAVAREFAVEHRVKTGLVCILQCLEPCWTFDRVTTQDGKVIVRGEHGKCSHLYHYYIHPRFGWMYVRLQTWFPFAIQVGINGREWLSRQMDQEKLPYLRSDNKFLCVKDWQRAQQLFDQQLQTDWVRELDALQQQVHPLHPGHLGRLPVKYNWTVFQSEWATDVAFRSQRVLENWYDRWLRQALLSYDSVDVLRFFGRSGRIYPKKRLIIETKVDDRFEGKRIKHWVQHNSLKLYTHGNVLRPETTINDPGAIQVLRPLADDAKGPQAMRQMRRTVVDLPQHATFSQNVNERYLEALATTAETRTLKELVEPLTCRVLEPRRKSGKPARQVRGLNPLAKGDADLLTAISDPKYMIHGLRNRDLVAALYHTETENPQERRRRSAHVTRQLRLLRAHGLLEKIEGTHRYQLSLESRTKIQALLAARNANPDKLITKAA
jgi:hypothetical protein